MAHNPQKSKVNTAKSAFLVKWSVAPTAPTKKHQQKHDLKGCSLPFPPVITREQAVNSPSKVGENWGSLFDSCSARNRSTTPHRPPPDHENACPDAVGTATGAKVRSVLRRTTPSYRKIVAHFSPTTPIKSATPLRIVIEATASGRKWIARLDDRVLCVSAWPFVKSTRLLLAESYPADTVVEIWRPNTDEWAMRGRLGAVAATIIEGERRRAAPRTALRLAIPSGVAHEGCR